MCLDVKKSSSLYYPDRDGILVEKRIVRDRRAVRCVTLSLHIMSLTGHPVRRGIHFLPTSCSYGTSGNLLVEKVSMLQKNIRPLFNPLFFDSSLSSLSNPRFSSPLFPYFFMNNRIKENCDEVHKYY